MNNTFIGCRMTLNIKKRQRNHVFRSYYENNISINWKHLLLCMDLTKITYAFNRPIIYLDYVLSNLM